MSSSFLVSFSQTYVGRFSIYVSHGARRIAHYLYERIQRIWNVCCFWRRQTLSTIPAQRPIENQVVLQPQALSSADASSDILISTQEAPAEQQTPRAMTPVSKVSEELLTDTSAGNLYPGYFESPISESMPVRFVERKRPVFDSTHSQRRSFREADSFSGQERFLTKEEERSVSRSALPFERSTSMYSDDSFDSQETYRSSTPQRGRLRQEGKQTVSMLDMFSSYFAT